MCSGGEGTLGTSRRLFHILLPSSLPPREDKPNPGSRKHTPPGASCCWLQPAGRAMMDEAAAAATVVCVVSAKCCAAVGGALHLPSPPQPLPGPSITLTCSMVSAGLLAPPAPSHGTRSTNSLFFAKSSSPCLVLRQRSAHPRPLKQARQSGNQPPPLLAPVPPLLLLLLRLSTEACSPSVLVSPEVDSGLHPAGGSTSRCPFPRVEAPAGLGWAGLAGNRKGVSVASSPTLLDSHARQTHSRSAFSFSGLPPSRQPLPPSVPTSLLSLSLSLSLLLARRLPSPRPRYTDTHRVAWVGQSQ